MQLNDIAHGVYGAFKNIYHSINTIKMRDCNRRANKLIPYYQDDISVKWLMARERFNITRDYTIFSKVEKSMKSNRKYFFSEFESGQDIVIVYRDKNDTVYKYTKQILDMSDFKNHYRSVSEEQYRVAGRALLRENEVVFPAVEKKDMLDILQVIKEKGDWDSCVIPNRDYIIAGMKWQYFDLFEPQEDEIVVDAGCFDGRTESDILDWGGVYIKKIYAFEMDPVNAVNCERYFRKNGLDEKVKLIRKGTWDKCTTMNIRGGCGTAASGLVAGKESGRMAELTTIDREVGDDWVTFIKMDVEGAELNTLKGAKQTICNSRPRLAVCLYHKPEDIFEIPEFILSIVPEYRFWIRHYASNECETVLYAKCI